MGFSDNNTSFKATFGELYTVPGGSGSSPVTSVNGKIGDVNLTASDVGAYTKEETEGKIEKKADKSELPKKLSDLFDDTGAANGTPITRAKTAETADKAGEAMSSNESERSLKDVLGNIIHEAYATKKEAEQFSDLAISAANYAISIAKGRATGYVFNTVTDMNKWLENPDNTLNLVLGDNLYIRATDVPDYWWDGSTPQPLETQKVDLTEYATKAELSAAIGEALEGDY